MNLTGHWRLFGEEEYSDEPHLYFLKIAHGWQIDAARIMRTGKAHSITRSSKHSSEWTRQKHFRHGFGIPRGYRQEKCAPFDRKSARFSNTNTRLFLSAKARAFERCSYERCALLDCSIAKSSWRALEMVFRVLFWLSHRRLCKMAE